MLYEHGFGGLNGLVVFDNQKVSALQNLSDLDRLAAIATCAPLGANPSGQLHYVEVWDLLTRKGRFIGAWAKKVALPLVGEPRINTLNLKLGTKWSKDRDVLV